MESEEGQDSVGVNGVDTGNDVRPSLDDETPTAVPLESTEVPREEAGVEEKEAGNDEEEEDKGRKRRREEEEEEEEERGGKRRKEDQEGDVSSEDEPKGETETQVAVREEDTEKFKDRPSLSAAAREKEDRLNANFAIYGTYTDEKLEEIVPRTADGVLTSIGAIMHKDETCSACVFHQSAKGCYNGLRCKFCHMEHPKKKRTRGRQRKQQAELKDGDRNGEEGDRNAKNGGKAPKTGDGTGGARRGKRKPSDGACDDVKVDHKDLDEHGNSRPSWLQDDADFFNTCGYTGCHTGHASTCPPGLGYGRLAADAACLGGWHMAHYGYMPMVPLYHPWCQLPVQSPSPSVTALPPSSDHCR